MGLVCSELILAMTGPQVLSETYINEAIVASPAIRVDDAVPQAYPSPNDCLQNGLGAIGHYFGVHAAIAFEDAEDDGFSVSASSPFALYSPGAELKGDLELQNWARRIRMARR